ncbi:hypothetical protein SEA_FUNSIZED_83 [Mycobacterium phage Funsized]|nr:hypothetical protein SEA_FUNSIZED_83 [Mycobacterium phage Funsized]
MGLLPKIDLDIVHTVNEFLTVLRSIDGKLDELLDEQREANRNSVLDRLGRTTRERMAFDRTAPDAAPADCSLGYSGCTDPHDDVLSVGTDLTEGGTR